MHFSRVRLLIKCVFFKTRGLKLDLVFKVDLYSSSVWDGSVFLPRWVVKLKAFFKSLESVDVAQELFFYLLIQNYS